MPSVTLDRPSYANVRQIKATTSCAVPGRAVWWLFVGSGSVLSPALLFTHSSSFLQTFPASSHL